ncbi:MAG: UDP-N-acetylmuramoyl-tripeptide--D-alanyl-D-alanine ligase [Enterobacterales bacterium]|nr:UDP-N-acetylmuramoyl-tripeptide--D-alanyl-D-alanine ligase [Enterobacterales bacterium]
MIPIQMSQIANKLNAQLIGDDCLIDKVYTDSRSAEQSGLFVALNGPLFDAHDFVSDAREKGADGFLLERKIALDKPQIVVKNTRLALAELARLNRQASDAEIVAITGSSGKTTVKEMVASILQQSSNILATKGNLNNEIGAPLTLLDIEENTQFAVIELGASQAGDIAFTADITAPQVALVNNIAAAHLAGFGSLQGVAKAKAEIYTSLTQQGVAIVNEDCDYADYFKSNIDCQMIGYSIESESDVYATEIKLTEAQSTHFNIQYQGKKQAINLPLLGRHNVANAVAAASCCLALDISLAQIAEGLSRITAVDGRLLEYPLSHGRRLIDDSYNANLSSVMAAIDLLANYANTTILVLGDLAELGDYGKSCHQKIGLYAAEKGIDKLYTYGDLTEFTQQAFRHSKGINNNNGLNQFHFSDQQKLIQQLQKEANAKQTILIKGSRSARMENIVHALREIDKNSSLEQASYSAETSIASPRGDY